jgi:hypothetical protein
VEKVEEDGKEGKKKSGQVAGREEGHEPVEAPF